MACDICALDKSYWIRHVMDSTSSSMQATAGGKTHHVAEHHYPVTRLQSVVAALNEAVGKYASARTAPPAVRLSPASPPRD